MVCLFAEKCFWGTRQPSLLPGKLASTTHINCFSQATPTSGGQLVVSAISNEVGRCKSFFLGCWPPRNTPVAYRLKNIDHSRFLCSPVTLSPCRFHRCGAAHQASLRSLRTMMTSANSPPVKGGGWPIQPDGDDSHHSRLQASPHRRHRFASVHDDRTLGNRSGRAA